MKTFTSFTLNNEYKRLEKPCDKLAEVNRLIDREAFRPIVKGMYNQTERGGRLNMGEVLMIRLPVLQQWHGLSGPDLEHIFPQVFRLSRDHTILFHGLVLQRTHG